MNSDYGEKDMRTEILEAPRSELAQALRRAERFTEEKEVIFSVVAMFPFLSALCWSSAGTSYSTS